jgi:pimeloyl-ACP methyl ester carboxylesterase
MLFFQLPRAPEALLGWAGPPRFARSLQRSGLDAATSWRYAGRAADPQALTGPINWYRAMPFNRRHSIGPIVAPTLLVWGDRDWFLTRAAAEASARFVAGPYRFVALAGAGHWLPSESAGQIAPPLLEHLASGRD